LDSFTFFLKVENNYPDTSSFASEPYQVSTAIKRDCGISERRKLVDKPSQLTISNIWIGFSLSPKASFDQNHFAVWLKNQVVDTLKFSDAWEHQTTADS
jgi:hypothetical protein